MTDFDLTLKNRMKKNRLLNILFTILIIEVWKRNGVQLRGHVLLSAPVFLFTPSRNPSQARGRFQEEENYCWSKK